MEQHFSFLKIQNNLNKKKEIVHFSRGTVDYMFQKNPLLQNVLCVKLKLLHKIQRSNTNA